MAVVVVDTAKSLKIQVMTGTSQAGDPVLSTRTLGTVNESVTNDDLMAIAVESGTLINYPIDAVKVTESYTLGNE